MVEQEAIHEITRNNTNQSNDEPQGAAFEVYVC
jgi:hypothetical protein